MSVVVDEAKRRAFLTGIAHSPTDQLRYDTYSDWLQDNYESDRQEKLKFDLLGLFREAPIRDKKVWISQVDRPTEWAYAEVFMDTHDGPLPAVLGGQSCYPPHHPFPIVPMPFAELPINLLRMYFQHLPLAQFKSRVIVRNGIIVAIEMSERSFIYCADELAKWSTMPAVYLTPIETGVLSYRESVSRRPGRRVLQERTRLTLNTGIGLESGHRMPWSSPEVIWDADPDDGLVTERDYYRRREKMWRFLWPWVGLFTSGAMPGEISNPRAYMPRGGWADISMRSLPSNYGAYVPPRDDQNN